MSEREYEFSAYAPHPQKPQPDKGDCTKVGYQYTDVHLPVELSPLAELGDVEIECVGEPEICCRNADCCNACELVVTQKVCIRIPVTYSVKGCGGEPTICCDEEKPCKA